MPKTYCIELRCLTSATTKILCVFSVILSLASVAVKPSRALVTLWGVFIHGFSVSVSHSQPQHQSAVTEAEDNLQSLHQQGTWHQPCWAAPPSTTELSCVNIWAARIQLLWWGGRKEWKSLFHVLRKSERNLRLWTERVYPFQWMHAVYFYIFPLPPH